jgi:hypothetical protein
LKNVFKMIGIIVAIVIIIPLLIALFINKDYEVEKEIVINKPKQQVFEYIKLLKHQDEYSIWGKMDPAAKKEFRKTDGTIGFVFGWESKIKDLGKGEQEIKNIIGNERIDYEIRFYEPYESTANAYMITTTVSENSTRVIWGFKGRMDYPMNIFLLFMDMKKIIGSDLEKGLANLKTILELK